MFIENLQVNTHKLFKKVVVVTGGGGDIATEAGIALAAMGAIVIVAEVRREKGEATAKKINERFPNQAIFLPLDLTDEENVQFFCQEVKARFGTPYAIIHNATIIPFDTIEVLPLEDWDKSYLVHLRGPLAITRFFLPEMKQEGQGACVFTPSSGAAPFMGAYEVFKTAQVELANTLSAELEGSGVFAYSIGPGFVKTETAIKGIEKIAPMMGITTEEFYKINEENTLSPEEAGVAFAVSLLFAEKYDGKEIGGIQALMDAELYKQTKEKGSGQITPKGQLFFTSIVKNFDEQYDGWKSRNIFERQWVLRDFKKYAGLSANEMSIALHRHLTAYEQKNQAQLGTLSQLLCNLQTYYQHQLEMMNGYIKDPKKREEFDSIIRSWIKDIEAFQVIL